MNQALSDNRREPPRETHRVVGLNMQPWIMYMRHANGWQLTSTHQEMPSACVVLMVVDSVILSVSQQPAKFLGKNQQMAAAVAQVVESCAQLLCFIVEDPAVAARNQEVHPRHLGFGPQSQHLHQPGLGAAHAQSVDDLENPDRPTALHAYSPRSSVKARSMSM